MFLRTQCPSGDDVDYSVIATAGPRNFTIIRARVITSAVGLFIIVVETLYLFSLVTPTRAPYLPRTPDPMMSDIRGDGPATSENELSKRRKQAESVSFLFRASTGGRTPDGPIAFTVI